MALLNASGFDEDAPLATLVAMDGFPLRMKFPNMPFIRAMIWLESAFGTIYVDSELASSSR